MQSVHVIKDWTATAMDVGSRCRILRYRALRRGSDRVFIEIETLDGRFIGAPELPADAKTGDNDINLFLRSYVSRLSDELF